MYNTNAAKYLMEYSRSPKLKAGSDNRILHKTKPNFYKVITDYT